MIKCQAFLILLLFLIKNVESESSVDEVTMSTSLECIRDCKENEPPKICYYNFEIEYYSVLGRACELCTPNTTNQFTSSCQCVIADGVEKGLLTVNRQYPGPSIQVCKNDTIVVDVTNHAEGISTSIHWHGVWQTGTPWSDGVPFVTQCPIVESNTFRYQFLAGNEGTHFWHSHSGLQKLDGICGTLIIREPKSVDLSGFLYDFDLPEHVVIISDWMHEYAISRFPGRTSYHTGQTPDSILINGKGNAKNVWTGCNTKASLQTFNVQPGKKYRFRLINAFASVCPAQFNIENHKLKIIATDGVAVKPVDVDTIISFGGERVDFIIKRSSSKTGSFWIQVKGIGECGIERVQQLAVLHYGNSPSMPKSKPPSYDKGLPLGLVLNPLNYSLCTNRSKQGICYHQLTASNKIKSLIKKKPDKRLNICVKFDNFQAEEFYAQNFYHIGLITPDVSSILAATLNNIRFKNPPSPLLSQRADINPEILCNDTTRPENCRNDVTCDCTYLQALPLNSLLEIKLSDCTSGPNLSHPFHLHGGVFQILNIGHFNTNNHGDDIDKNDIINQNSHNPPFKDTIAIPHNGYVILRAWFTNPGYWFFHCHFLYHIVIGMSMTFQIGTEKQIPMVPPNFPTCGHFKTKISNLAEKL